MTKGPLCITPRELFVLMTGYTALHDACYYGFEEVADELCRRGAKVNAFDKDGKTPLHVCILFRFWKQKKKKKKKVTEPGVEGSIPGSISFSDET